MKTRIGGIVVIALALLRFGAGCSSDKPASDGAAGAGSGGHAGATGAGGVVDAAATGGAPGTDARPDVSADMAGDHPAGSGGTQAAGGAGGAGAGGSGAGGAAGAIDGGLKTDGAIDGSADAAVPTLSQIWSTILTDDSTATSPSCVDCHDGGAGIPDYTSRDRTYASWVGVPSTSCPPGIRVTAGNAETSVLINKLRAGSNFGLAAVCGGAPMPATPNGRITLDQLHMIEAWINAGAPNN